MPVRIRRRRIPGWRKPAGAVIVDRTSRWGNPFTVTEALEQGWASNEQEARTVAAGRFRTWLLGLDADEPDVFWIGSTRPRPLDRRWMRTHLDELRGRDLCCPCPDNSACHAAELLLLANQPQTAN